MPGECRVLVREQNHFQFYAVIPKRMRAKEYKRAGIVSELPPDAKMATILRRND